MGLVNIHEKKDKVSKTPDVQTGKGHLTSKKG